MKDLTIVIPAYNEAHSIAGVISDCLKFCGEILVIDDASTDDTKTIARSAGAVVVTNDKNSGYEASLSRGFGLALSRGSRMLASFDADGEHRVDELEKLCRKHLRDSNIAITVGRRDRFNRLSERLVGLWGRYRLGVRDPLCGLKVYSEHFLRSEGVEFLYGFAGIDKLIAATRNHLKVVEVNILVGKRVGTSRYGAFIEGEKKVLRVLAKSEKLFRSKCGNLG